MAKKQKVAAVEKSNVGLIVAVLTMFTEMEIGWKPREIRAFAEQMVVLWSRVKNPAEFVQRMNEFFAKVHELRIPSSCIGRLMARELRK